MEVLRKLLEHQSELEDAIKLETTPEEIKETKFGKDLLKRVRRRGRLVRRCVKMLTDA